MINADQFWSIMFNQSMYIVFDIGATIMRVAFSEDGASIGEPLLLPTPELFEDGMETLKDCIKSVSGGKTIKAVAGGIAGPLDSAKQTMVRSRLTDWVGKPITERIETMTNAPVYLQNDTAMVGLGEAHVGAGKDIPIVVYITVSTGVGGVRIVNGSIDSSAQGFEPGHQIIEASSIESAGRGELESLISGSGITERFGKVPSDVHDATFWKEEAYYLACGIYNTILFWSPDVVVLGGGIVLHTQLSLDLVSQNVARLMKIFPHVPEIKKAELSEFGGLHGSLVWLKHNTNQ